MRVYFYGYGYGYVYDYVYGRVNGEGHFNNNIYSKDEGCTYY